MNTEQTERAAEILWEHWQTGRRLEALPDSCRPATRHQGYAVQAQIERRSAHPRFGWKIAATSAAGQAHIAVTGPLAGRLLRERVHASGATVPCGANHMRVAEAEFAFRMARDLPPRSRLYETPEVLEAVATLHPAIEIPDSRFDDFTRAGEPQLIADNACAHYFVLGPASAEIWRSLDLVAHPVVGRLSSGESRTGVGANVLGDPRVALTWLVNEVSALGLTLHAGEVVTTGTCLTPLTFAPGDRFTADFGTLGTVAVQIDS